jgi:hypothetical protein
MTDAGVVLVDALSDVVGLIGTLVKGTVAICLHLGTLVLEERCQVVDLLRMERTKTFNSLKKLSFTAGGGHLRLDGVDEYRRSVSSGL